MTWEQFMNSEYNEYVDEWDNKVSSFYTNEDWAGPTATGVRHIGYAVTDDGDEVDKTDLIKNNYTYYVYCAGSSND